MQKLIRNIFSLLPEAMKRNYYEQYFHNNFVKWEKSSKKEYTPHYLKQKAIKKYQKEFGIKNFVESGTFLGDMIYMMLPYFEHLYSIELSNQLYVKALRRFKKYKNVHLLHGDSGIKLKEIVDQTKSSMLFWLDGHYSAGITAKGNLNTPIVNELKIILNSNNQSVILIDDARLFNGTEDYPTLEEISSIVNKFSNSPYCIDVSDDIIHLIPKLNDNCKT